MTPEEKAEWKSKALPLLQDHLAKTIGYPNHMDNAQIMQQLPAMFQLLGANRLIMPGMTFQAFCHFAEKKYMEAEIHRIIGL